MNRIRKLAQFLLIGALLLTPAAAYEPIEIRLMGEPAMMDGRLIGSTTYVNLDLARNLLGAADDSITVRAIPGTRYIEARGRYIGGSPNLQIDGALYIPIRSAAEIFGNGVEWQEDTRSVDLTAGIGSGIVPGDAYYDADEVFWLARIIHAEAQGEPMEGKILVGNVVLNRRRHADFPDSIYGVIFDSKYGIQFTPAATGTVYNTPSHESVVAAKICLDGYSLSDSALYFLNPRIAENFWIPANRPYITSVGSHDFYA